MSWTRRSEYISPEFNRFHQSAEKPETQVGFYLKKLQENEERRTKNEERRTKNEERRTKNEDVYKDRGSQIAAIEKTFEDAKVPVEKHFKKPGVYAVEVGELARFFL